MFQVSDKRTISRIIDSARQAILKTFVPNHLGFGHVTRQDVIDHHTTTIARELMSGGSTSTAIAVLDGTYIYIQVRNNFSSPESAFFGLVFRNLEITNFREKRLVYIKKIFIKADDDCNNNWLHYCLHWTFFLGFQKQ
jgi:hypothetical protein